MALAAVLAVVVALYANGLGNPFHFDDEHSITGNPAVRSLSHAGSFFTDVQTFSRTRGSGMFRPLVVLSYAVNHALGGYAVEGYHLANLGFHLAAVALVFALLRATGVGVAVAAAGAALFGLNPLTSEPVNYISSRSESMALVLALASYLLYLRPRRRRLCAAASLVCFGLALLCKSVAAVLPVLLIAHELVVRCRPVRHWWRAHAAYWGLTALYVVASRHLLVEALAPATAVRPWAAQVASQICAAVYYLKLLAFPWPLSVEAPVREMGGPTEPASLAGLTLGVSIIWVVWRWPRGWNRQALYGLVWAFVALAPTFVVPLNVVAAERRLYPALVGAVLFLVHAAPLSSRRGLWLCAAALVLFGALGHQRNQVWATQMDLWTDAARRAPDAVRPHLRLGVLLRQQGDLAGAESELGRALALDPRSAPAWNNLGNVHAARGDLDSAAVRYQQALDLLPAYPEAMINLGTAYSRQGRHVEAVDLLRRALPLAGRRPELLGNLGTAHLRAGQYDEAARILGEAVEIGPASAAMLHNLGGALEGKGDAAGAVVQYGRAVSLDPGYAKAYLRLAVLLERSGRRRQAADAYRAFVARWRGDPQVALQARARLEALEHRP